MTSLSVYNFRNERQYKIKPRHWFVFFSSAYTQLLCRYILHFFLFLDSGLWERNPEMAVFRQLIIMHLDETLDGLLDGFHLNERHLVTCSLYLSYVQFYSYLGFYKSLGLSRVKHSIKILFCSSASSFCYLNTFKLFPT